MNRPQMRGMHILTPDMQEIECGGGGGGRYRDKIACSPPVTCCTLPSFITVTLLFVACQQHVRYFTDTHKGNIPALRSLRAGETMCKCPCSVFVQHNEPRFWLAPIGATGIQTIKTNNKGRGLCRAKGLRRRAQRGEPGHARL